MPLDLSPNIQPPILIQIFTKKKIKIKNPQLNRHQHQYQFPCDPISTHSSRPKPAPDQQFNFHVSHCLPKNTRIQSTNQTSEQHEACASLCCHALHSDQQPIQANNQPDKCRHQQCSTQHQNWWGNKTPKSRIPELMRKQKHHNPIHRPINNQSGISSSAHNISVVMLPSRTKHFCGDATMSTITPFLDWRNKHLI